MSIKYRIERLLQWMDKENAIHPADHDDIKQELTDIHSLLSDDGLEWEERPKRYNVVFDKLATIPVIARNRGEAYEKGQAYLDECWVDLVWTDAEIKEVEFDGVEEDEN